MVSERALEYFEIIAESGITKHGGSVQATRELVQMCHIEAGKYVLDVGCGVGATPSYLAKELGCRVMGVDLLDKMVEQARRRAKSEGVQDRTEFRVADARELPFEDDLFDAVITESVNIFFEDKEPAMHEYVRVTKPGGYVGITEAIWLNPPSYRIAHRCCGAQGTPSYRIAHRCCGAQGTVRVYLPQPAAVGCR